jgi:phytoene desaturase
VHNRDQNIRGLYFVGAGTHPGAGISGVVNSAKATAAIILDDYKSALAFRAGCRGEIFLCMSR